MTENHNRVSAVSAGIAELDPVLEHRIRLGACVLLTQVEALAFARLKGELGATDGNLGAQLRKLEEEGYVRSRKEFRDRKPVTWYSLTSQGRSRLKGHLTAMEKLIRNSEVG